MTGPGAAATPSWPQLAAWMVLAAPSRLSGRWRRVEGRRERTGTFIYQAPDIWLVLDERGRRTEHFDVQHLLQPDPFDHDDDDYHQPTGAPEAAVHDGRTCWQVSLQPPAHKRGLLTMTVDEQTGLRVQQRNDAYGDLVEVSGLQVDRDLDPALLAKAQQRRAKADSERDLYQLTRSRPAPSPAWFPWRRGWAEKDDCWIVEADAGGGSVGRAPLGEQAPVGYDFEDQEELVARLDHGGYSWAVAADPPLSQAEARQVVESTTDRPPF